MPRRPSLAALFLGLVLLCPGLGSPLVSHAAPVPGPGITPSRLWVAWLDGRALEDAMATPATLLDRFPDAVLVADERSAQVLKDAGFRLEPPIDVPAGRTVSLVRAHGTSAPEGALSSNDFSSQGATLLWQGGRDVIAASDGPLPESGKLLFVERKVLRSQPLRTRPKPQAGDPMSLATVFEPVIQPMVDQVSGATFMDWIGKLAGTQIVTVGATPVRFRTRSTPTTSCDQAEQYVFERFQAMGFTDVQYDPYTFSSTSARNVVATLPGVSRPGRVVILGAHLDSTSPQASTLAPGANDNASGVAGLLMAAEILRQHEFDCTIKFIAFTGEEQGLFGSTHYANAAAARGDSILGAVIFDMIAWHDALYQIDIEGETAWLPIMNVMDDACSQYTSLGTQIQLFSFGSDHVPFQDVGYPSFLAIESEYDNYPCYHQTCDTTSWNEPALGADVVRASLATVAHLAVPHQQTFAILHTPLASTENTAGPYEVIARITKVSPLLPDSLQLHWSSGGAVFDVPLVPTGVTDQYHAFIPGQPSTSRVTYWLSAADSAGSRLTSPAAAPASVYTFYVSTRSNVLAEGFEGAAPGWTHGGTGDDWQIGTPGGLGGDPATAFAGTRVAGNDLTGLGGNLGHYEDNSENWFESPAVNCSTLSQVRLSFARWLGVERSNGTTWDWARVLVNGTKVWESNSAANTLDAAWQPQDLDISAFADGNPSVKVRFLLHSDGSINYAGWNLDEVKISGISTQVTTGVADHAPARALLLFANAPNPGTPGTTLRFELPSRGEVELAIYDVRGRRVRTVLHEVRDAGRHSIAWNGRTDGGDVAAPGVYFTRLLARGETLTRKLIVMR